MATTRAHSALPQTSTAHRARAVRRRPAAFAAVYRAHHQALFRYCRAILGHDEDARDALQSTMARAYAALQHEERDFDLRPWLFRIAHNESISLLRRRRGDVGLEAAAGLGEETLERRVGEREQLAELRSDLADLPERQRSALVMRELSGLPHEQIAAALGISSGAAKQAIFEARSALHECREGRTVACEEMRRTISDADGRVLRGRKVRAHLRSCAGCRDFADALRERPRELQALAPPLPLAAGAAVLAHLLPGAKLAAAGASSAGAAGAAGATGAGLVGSKAAVGLAVVACAAGGATVVHEEQVHHRQQQRAAKRAAAVTAAPARAAGAAAPALVAAGVPQSAARAASSSAPASTQDTDHAAVRRVRKDRRHRTGTTTPGTQTAPASPTVPAAADGTSRRAHAKDDGSGPRHERRAAARKRRASTESAPATADATRPKPAYAKRHANVRAKAHGKTPATSHTRRQRKAAKQPPATTTAPAATSTEPAATNSTPSTTTTTSKNRSARDARDEQPES